MRIPKARVKIGQALPDDWTGEARRRAAQRTPGPCCGHRRCAPALAAGGATRLQVNVDDGPSPRRCASVGTPITPVVSVDHRPPRPPSRAAGVDGSLDAWLVEGREPIRRPVVPDEDGRTRWPTSPSCAGPRREPGLAQRLAGQHTPVAIATQGTFGTCRARPRTLTPAAGTLAGIVEELFPMAGMSDQHAFYGSGGDDAELQRRFTVLMDSCARFGAAGALDLVPTSQFRLRPLRIPPRRSVADAGAPSLNLTLDGCCDHPGRRQRPPGCTATASENRADALLFGRVTYQPDGGRMAAAARRAGARDPFVRVIDPALRVRRLRHLDAVDWNAELVAAPTWPRPSPGCGAMATGSSSVASGLAQSFAAQGLIDTYRLLGTRASRGTAVTSSSGLPRAVDLRLACTELTSGAVVRWTTSASIAGPRSAAAGRRRVGIDGANPEHQSMAVRISASERTPAALTFSVTCSGRLAPIAAATLSFCSTTPRRAGRAGAGRVTIGCRAGPARGTSISQATGRCCQRRPCQSVARDPKPAAAGRKCRTSGALRDRRPRSGRPASPGRRDHLGLE